MGARPAGGPPGGWQSTKDAVSEDRDGHSRSTRSERSLDPTTEGRPGRDFALCKRRGARNTNALVRFHSQKNLSDSQVCLFHLHPHLKLFFLMMFIFHWRIIALQCCAGFYHTNNMNQL